MGPRQQASQGVHDRCERLIVCEPAKRGLHRVGRDEPATQSDAATAFRTRQVMEVGHQGQVLLARQEFVHGGELARDADVGDD